MPGFFNNLLHVLRGRRGRDIRFMCRQLLSERGEASQTALAPTLMASFYHRGPSRVTLFSKMAS